MLPWNTGAVVAIAPPVRCSTFPFQPKQFPPPTPKKKKKKKNQNSPSRVTLEDILYNQLLLLFFGLYFILYYP